jgi:hypothetical protein
VESGSVESLQVMERSMTDDLNRQRVQRLRQSRRERGLKEVTVWLDQSIASAIDHAVERGHYPSRQAAMSAALQRIFSERDSKSVI